jgi:hypothetical protein
MRILFWNRRASNFQAVFDNYLQDFKVVLDNGIQIEEFSFKIYVKLHCFFADSHARQKVINSTQ